MVEVRAGDWAQSLAWYRDVLGLTVAMTDPARAFALLDAGPARVAIRGGAPASPSISLVFEVDDLDVERDRLARLGQAMSGPIDHPDEGFREVRVHDPDGNPIVLFAWTDQPATTGRT